jgi:hypothetical protein
MEDLGIGIVKINIRRLIKMKCNGNMFNKKWCPLIYIKGYMHNMK